MKLHYSKEADALYLRFKESEITDTDEIVADVIVDFDTDGNVIGLEILSVSGKADLEQLTVQAFEKVMVEN
ncbi:DUF2283 domain-containing protein [Candidatus Magnetominusculus dajiuhuensis]|uniref:DUF2283 domain-containing protein n=1 Tax=Candidatus Magnetominusculus dajiuhuensis TaxID=3137712 RepID=UPI003B434DA1